MTFSLCLAHLVHFSVTLTHFVRKVILILIVIGLLLVLTGCPPNPNKPPTVTKLSGPEGTIDQINSTFSWSGNDPDGSISKYEYRKDGGAWTNHALNTNYTWNDYAEGAHTFEVRAQDNEGAYSNTIKWSFTYSSIEEEPYITWQKFLGGSYRDFARSIQQTNDGGYIVAGYTESNDGDVSGNHGNYDFWVVKLSSTGSLQWQKCLGGSDDEWAYSIQQTSDGGYIVAGYTESNDGDVSGNHGGGDFWVVKLSSTGSLQWQKCLGGSSWDEAYSIQQTSDGGYIVAGGTYSNDGDVSGNHGYYDFWVVKLSSTGTLQWQKCLGGSSWDEAYSIQQTSDGGYIVAGSTYSNDGDVSGNHGEVDFWVVKLSSTGSLQWQKCLGGSRKDEAYSIQQTSDGGYIVAGYTESNDGDVSENPSYPYRSSWVVKLSSTGSLQWQKCLGNLLLDTLASSIQQTSDGGYIVIQNVYYDPGGISNLRHDERSYDPLINLDTIPSGSSWTELIKLDSVGDFQWYRIGIDRLSFACSIKQTSDGGYILTGTGWSSYQDFSVVKLGKMQTVLIEGGTFMMGDEFGDLQDSCRPVHEVTLTYDFEVGKHEITFDQYDRFCEATSRTKPDANWYYRGPRPVVNVSWWDAIAYCNWLSEKEGLPKPYDEEGNLLDPDGNVTTDITKVVGYRLPTAAEWEYAARGGKYHSPYKYSGSNNVDEVAWYWDNSGNETHDVGQKLPNALGIYDMSGNVWEWCSDWWYWYTETPKTNPYNSTPNPPLTFRMAPGGSWVSSALGVRVAYRYAFSPSDTLSSLGFRIARTVP